MTDPQELSRISHQALLLLLGFAHRHQGFLSLAREAIARDHKLYIMVWCSSGDGGGKETSIEDLEEVDMEDLGEALQLGINSYDKSFLEEIGMDVEDMVKKFGWALDDGPPPGLGG